MSSNIYKGSFVQFTSENTRVIDTNALVLKRMEDYSSVLRERESLNDSQYETEYDEEGNPVERLTAEYEGEYEEGLFDENGEYDSDVQNDAIPVNNGPITLDVDEIRAECQELIDKANAEAERILENARIAAEDIRANAGELGYQEGLENGRNAGLQEFVVQKALLDTQKEELEAKYQALVDEFEPKLVEAIVSVYEHVLGNGLYDRRDVISHLIKRALNDTETENQIIVHVNDDDYDLIFDRFEDIVSQKSFTHTPELRRHSDYVKGECKIETNYGIIECSIDTQIAELNKTLRALSFEKNSNG